MINLIAPINQLSYGYVSSEILYNYPDKVKLYTIGPVQVEKKYENIYNESINRAFEKGPSLRIFHEFDLALHAGFPRVSYSFFELDKVKEEAINHLKYQNAVIVPTKWAASVLENQGITSFVVPLGVGEEFKPLNQPNKPRFATIGKFEIRKGHDILPGLFAKALPNDCELWCFTDNPFCNEDEIKWWKNKFRNSLGNRVKFFPRLPSIIDYLSYCHAGIFISRGEGWNLGCLEMMAMGKHVIVTNYSGHTEYCNKNNSYLIDIDNLEPANDGKWFFGEANWAHLGKNQEDQIIESIRSSYNNFTQVNYAGIETAKQYPFKTCAQRINDVVIRVQKECDKDC